MHVPEIQKLIRSKIPLVLPQHNEQGHWYEVTESGEVYPSVTTCLQVLKDNSLRNYAVNRSMDYIFEHQADLTPENIMEHLDKAKRASTDLRDEAGNVGNDIHRLREEIYKGKDISGDIAMTDRRVVSGTRGIKKFLKETGYVPVEVELMVYSVKLQVAGALDDIGLMPQVYRAGEKDCKHVWVESVQMNKYRHCTKCRRKVRYKLVLMDLKTSNQKFKHHYALQVALYTQMFTELTGLRPKDVFILHVSKTDGTYDMVDLKDTRKAFAAAKHAVNLWHAMDKVQNYYKPERIEI
jgi:hypothetical protein